MSDYKLVPVEPTPEMVESAESAYMLFEDMELALMMAVLAAPAVQGEPVGWQFYKDGKWWHGNDCIKGHRKNTEEAGYLTRDVYAAPQPTEQQPAPDVAGLVEALTELCDEIDNHEIHTSIAKTSILWFKRKARAALAAHRKQGGEV